MIEPRSAGAADGRVRASSSLQPHEGTRRRASPRDGRGRPPTTGRFAVLVVLLLHVLLLAGCSDNSHGGNESAGQAPNFTLTAADGSVVQLSDLRGKVVLLHFWATWCAPCRAAIPHDNRLQQRFRNQGFAVLGINLDKDPEAVEEFLKRNEVLYPTLFLDEPTRKAYGGVPTIPLTIVIDRRGRIRKKTMGFTLQQATAIEALIESLLDEEKIHPYGA